MSPNQPAIDPTGLLEEALSVWRSCPASAPEMPVRFDQSQQAAGEQRLSALFEILEAELKTIPTTRDERASAHRRLTAGFAAFATASLGLSEAQLHLLLDGGLSSIGTALARQARQFDPAVSLHDVLQASRNAWTACALQMLYGRPMHLTPSIFAYSMLYPYSDNYLDDPLIGADAKRGFSGRFSLRLNGTPIAPANRREDAIWRLVSLIESEYDRALHPRVFESLGHIQNAQVRSLMLLGQASSPVDVARLSFAKGGTSVLADAYLAAGTLQPAQARFSFHWGVLLQLADDLQDVDDDRRAGRRTVFTEDAGRTTLDEATSRTLHFARWVMAQLAGLNGAGDDGLAGLIRRSSLSLIVRSAGEAAPLYSPAYIAAMETQSPFRFAFLSRMRARRQMRSGPMMRLFEAFLAGDPDEPAFPLLPGSLVPR